LKVPQILHDHSAPPKLDLRDKFTQILSREPPIAKLGQASQGENFGGVSEGELLALNNTRKKDELANVQFVPPGKDLSSAKTVLQEINNKIAALRHMLTSFGHQPDDGKHKQQHPKKHPKKHRDKK